MKNGIWILLLLVVSLLMGACTDMLPGTSPTPVPSDPPQAVFELHPPSSGTQGVQVLSRIVDSSGLEIAVLGNYDNTGVMATFGGVVFARADGGSWVYLTGNQPGLDYFYGVASDGSKEPIVMIWDTRRTDTVSVEVWEQDWANGTSTLLTSGSLPVTEASAPAASLGRVRTLETPAPGADEIETSFWELVKTDISYRLHPVVDAAWKLSETIVQNLNDNRLTRAWDAMVANLESTEAIVAAEDAGTFPEPVMETEANVQTYNTTVTEAVKTEEGSPVVPGADAGIHLVSGDDQEGTALQVLDEPIVVKITGADGSPVSGEEVTFDTFEGSPVKATTDAQGQASFTWTLTDGLGAKIMKISRASSAAFAGRNSVSAVAFARPDANMIKFRIDGFKVYLDKLSTNVPNLEYVAAAYGYSAYYVLRYPISFDGINPNYEGSPAGAIIQFPASGEGSFHFDPTLFATKIVYQPFYFRLSGDLAATMGYPADWANHWYSTNMYPINFTVTVHTDGNMYWGSFSGDIMEDYPYHTAVITEGSFKFMIPPAASSLGTRR